MHGLLTTTGTGRAIAHDFIIKVTLADIFRACRVLLLLLAGTAWWAASLRADVAAVAARTITAAPEPAIIERAANHRIWRTVRVFTNYAGGVPQVQMLTNKVTELASGVCYQLADGSYADSNPEVVLAADGGAEATQLPHKLYCSADLYKPGAIRLTLPSGEVMSSTFRGLYFYDVESQRSVHIASITNCIGVIYKPNKIVYSNCVAGSGVSADLVLTVTPAGLEQDIVLHERLPFSPTDAGLNPATTIVEAITEFFTCPVPEKETRTLPAEGVSGEGLELADETLRFASMSMQEGRAYSRGTTNAVAGLSAGAAVRESIAVGKTWQQDGNRKFLRESVRWLDLQKHLNRLRTNSSSLTNAAVSKRVPDGLVQGRGVPSEMLADAAPTKKVMHLGTLRPSNQDPFSEPVFIWDYILVGGTYTSFTFKSRENYLVSGPVTIGSAVIEDAIIKFSGYESNPGINITGSVLCKTSPSRMAVLTASTDATIGELVGGGNPEIGGHAYPALSLGSTAAAADIKYLKIRYAFRGVNFNNTGKQNKLRHCQISDTAVSTYSVGNTLAAHNNLFVNVFSAFEGQSFTVNAQHLTVHNAVALALGSGGAATVNLVNSLIVGTAGCEGATCSSDASSVWIELDEPIFASSGLGSHYLPNNSAYHRVGLSPIDMNLREDLKAKSTYAPMNLAASYTANTTLFAGVPRNLGPNYDIGYSYDVIDYYADGVVVENCILLITNGLTIGFGGGVQSSAFELRSGGRIYSESSPERMNRFLHCRYLQEGYGNQNPRSTIITGSSPGGALHEIRLRFTEMIANTATDPHLLVTSYLGALALTDCQFREGALESYGATGAETRIGFTNNLFEFVRTRVSGVNSTTHFEARNNLFRGGQLDMLFGSFAWGVRDNLFHGVLLTANGSNIGNSHNGYYATQPLAGSGPNYVLPAAVSFGEGPLGKYYLPSGSSPLLSGGSRIPADAALFHHTTQLSQLKEGQKPLDQYGLIQKIDVGFHYVALTTSNVARHKAVTQSSTDAGAVPGRAIDGNVSGNFAAGSVSKTLSQNQPWWQIDLGYLESLESVKIWNRTDCCGSALADFYVLVSDDPFESTDLTTTLNQPGVSSYFHAGPAGQITSIPINRSGQYLRIQLSGQNTLALAEVEVFWTPRPFDKDGDTLADAWEDRDGDNQADTGESPFNGPLVTITAPANGFSVNTSRINVRGAVTHSSPIKTVTVNGALAFRSGSTFDALNQQLIAGANRIVAVAVDENGNVGSASISISALPSGQQLQDPVRLQPLPVAGFAPLAITFQPIVSTPGALVDVLYDFNGDNVIEQTRTDFAPIAHTYTSAGEFFPVVTVRTTAGNFSSEGGFNATTTNIVTVDQVPTEQPFNVTDPVDVKAAADGTFYVISRSTATLSQFNSQGTLLRSLSSIGATPTGLDVDLLGHVYVAVSGNHQIKKLLPTPTSFQLHTGFGSSGAVGSFGSGSAQFNAPYDVTASPNGDFVYVSDSGNHRIQKFSNSGQFQWSFGSAGSGSDQFQSPKGIAFAQDGTLLITDSGNNRIVQFRDDDADTLAFKQTFGVAGTALGQFQLPLNAAGDVDAFYVADTGNNRIQKIDRQTGFPQWIFPSQLGFSQPAGVAVASDPLQESLYVADTGNNRIVKITIPPVDPVPEWTGMRQNLISGNTEAALGFFSPATVDSYRSLITSIPQTQLGQYMTEVAGLVPVYINRDEALYRFQNTLDGQDFRFVISFVKENGKWKILNF
jgi:hypothetical protein